MDEHGEMRSPPPFEPTLDRCPGCAEVERLRAAVRSSALANEPGVQVALSPWDPARGPLTLPDPTPPGEMEGMAAIPGRPLSPS